jgi:hypothetical protein
MGSLGFFVDLILRKTTMARVDSASNRNVVPEIFPDGKGGRRDGLTMLPRSCADYLEILGASISWTVRSLSRPVKEKFYIFSQMHIYILFERIHKWTSDAVIFVGTGYSEPVKEGRKGMHQSAQMSQCTDLAFWSMLRIWKEFHTKIVDCSVLQIPYTTKGLFSHVCQEISINLTGVKIHTFHNIGIYFYVTVLTASSDRSLHSSTAMYVYYVWKYRKTGFYVVREPDCQCSGGESSLHC